MVSDDDGRDSDVIGYGEFLGAMTRSTSATGSGYGMDVGSLAKGWRCLPARACRRPRRSTTSRTRTRHCSATRTTPATGASWARP
eukprot:15870466-Heterocapsa_arctica.AAC.1